MTHDIDMGLPRDLSRRQIRVFLDANAEDYDGPTALVEAADLAFDLPESWLDDPDHWIWDEAFEAHERARPKP